MKVKVDYDDGTEPEELEVTPGSVHFHPLPPDFEGKPKPKVEILEEDPVEGEDQQPGEFWQDVAGDEFDPGLHTITEVKDYVNTLPDDEAGGEEILRLLDAEEQGQNRVTLMDWLNQQLA